MYIHETQGGIIVSTNQTKRGVDNMDVIDRIKRAMLLEEMKKNEAATERLGLKDVSSWIRTKKKKDECLDKNDVKRSELVFKHKNDGKEAAYN